MVLLESYILLKEDIDDVEMIGCSEIGVPRELSLKELEEVP